MEIRLGDSWETGNVILRLWKLSDQTISCQICLGLFTEIFSLEGPQVKVPGSV